MVSLEPITTVLTSITNCCAISFLPLNYSDNYELFISIDNLTNFYRWAIPYTCFTFVCLCYCLLSVQNTVGGLYNSILFWYSIYNIGIKHGFPCINVCHVPREMLKTEAVGRGFQHLPRDLANVNVLEINV